MDELIVHKARMFAEEAHKGQLDDDGKDYFTAHVAVVALLIGFVGISGSVTPEMIAAAYLHDVVEDTEVTLEEVRAEFGDTIAGYVQELTHEGSKDNHGYYFPHLKSREAIIIKLADRMSNLTRMTSWPKKRQEQYLKKTKFWKSEGPDVKIKI